MAVFFFFGGTEVELRASHHFLKNLNPEYIKNFYKLICDNPIEKEQKYLNRYFTKEDT
jgi:chorismate mutase